MHTKLGIRSSSREVHERRVSAAEVYLNHRQQHRSYPQRWGKNKVCVAACSHVHYAARMHFHNTAAVHCPAAVAATRQHVGIQPTSYSTPRQEGTVVVAEHKNPWTETKSEKGGESAWKREMNQKERKKKRAWLLITKVPADHVANSPATGHVGARFSPCSYINALYNMCSKKKYIEIFDTTPHLELAPKNVVICCL